MPQQKHWGGGLFGLVSSGDRPESGDGRGRGGGMRGRRVYRDGIIGMSL
jgi:hypothetical protein